MLWDINLVLYNFEVFLILLSQFFWCYYIKQDLRSFAQINGFDFGQYDVVGYVTVALQDMLVTSNDVKTIWGFIGLKIETAHKIAG